jgi:methylglutaconyl-CoA hydratase
MNRPDRHNAFDETLIAELTAACVALNEDIDVRVVILAGRGKSFSAGADLNWMKRAANNGLDDNLNDARALAKMLRVLAEMKKPTIARVQGAALGGGMGLAAACDIAVASTKAMFATSEVKFGIIPRPFRRTSCAPSAPARLTATSSRPSASTPPGPATSASSMKPSNRNNSMPRSAKSSTHCCRAAPLASRCQGADPRGQWPTDQRRAGRRHCPPHCPPARHPEAREGIAAFLDKRQPNWIGE